MIGTKTSCILVVLSILCIHGDCKPFEDQHMLDFPADMASPRLQAVRDSGVKGGSYPPSNPTGGFEPDAGPTSPDVNFSAMPFSSECEHHVITSTNNGAPKHHMNHNDTLAFYPMSDDKKSRVTVYIHIQSDIYKTGIFGSSIDIKHCDVNYQNCEEINSHALKGRPLIFPNEWNYVYGNLREKKVELNVNKITSITFDIKQTMSEMADAEWYFAAEDVNPDAPETVTTSNGSPAPSWYYVAQYPCAEYKKVTGTSSGHKETLTGTDSTDTTTDGLSTAAIVGIIIGVILVAIIISIVAVMINKSFKTRNSANISTEQTAIAGKK